MASGRATTPTITPAAASDLNWDRVYDLRVVTDFGTNKTVKPRRRSKTGRRPLKPTVSRQDCGVCHAPIVSGCGPPHLLPAQIPRADPSGARAGGNQPDFLAVGPAHLPARNRRL